MKEFLFYLFATIILCCSVLSVSTRKILRAAVYLMFVLIATACLYFLWDYLFMAAVQLMLYAGGIVVLIVFSVLLTNKIEDRLDSIEMKKKIATALAVAFGAAMTLSVILQTSFVPQNQTPAGITVKDIGRSFMSYGDNGYILPFEVISVLLLAAMVGAIMIAKKNKNKAY